MSGTTGSPGRTHPWPRGERAPLPDATWGVHLADPNIAMADLAGLVKRQIARYNRK
jgi:hypothetical protein